MATTNIKNAYKIKIGRKHTQVTTYENLQLVTSQPLKKKNPKKIKKQIPNLPEQISDYAGYNYYNRMKKRRAKVRELCHNNFDIPNTVMLTLTFDGEYSDITKANHAFNLFIKRINSHYKDFKYIATYSRQSNMNWHYHVLCNFDDSIRNETISAIWKNGLTYVSYIRDRDGYNRAVQYLVDNLNECSEDKKGKRGYLASSNLQHDIIVTSWRADDEKQFNEVFPAIESNRRSVLYEAKRHIGIQGKNVNEETGEIFDVQIQNRELTPALEQAGYKSWDSTFTHLSSSARFDSLFDELKSAEPQRKKYKRMGL